MCAAPDDKAGPEGDAAASERLDSWKEIAAYLKREVRTVQLWEKNEALPVHRHVHKGRASVYAFKKELDAWWNNSRPRLEKEAVQPAPVRQPLARLGVAVAVGVVLVLGVLLVWQQYQRKRIGPVVPIRAIAVLPLENLSGDAEEDYFADGITEALITELGRLGDVRVVSRTTAMSYKDTGKSLPEIGRELRVDAVVEGSVLRAGSDVRITIKLIDVRRDEQLWAESYVGTMRDIIRFQDEAARTIAARVLPQLPTSNRAHQLGRYVLDPVAHVAYLKGRYYWNKRTEANLKRAVEFYQQAIEKDPGYAPAYAGLADCYNLLSVWGSLPERETFPKAAAAATRALELDDSLAEGHTSLAFVQYRHYWDWAAAQREFQRAIELNPNYATGHHWYAEFLQDVGSFEEARAEYEKALEVDPLSPIIRSDFGIGLFYMRRYEQAEQQLRATLAVFPDFLPAHAYLGTTLTQMGKHEEAIAHQGEALEVSGSSPVLKASVAHAYAAAGQKDLAARLLPELNELARRGQLSRLLLAEVYAALGEKERALALLEAAFEEHTWWLVVIKVEPKLDPLRDERRFEQLLRRMNFPQ